LTLKKLAGETVLYGMSHILPRVLNFVIMTPYLTYKFDKTADYGIFNDLYAYATIIISLMVFRMDTAYFRFASKEDKQNEAQVYSNTFLIMATISTLVIICMLVFKQAIANYLGYPSQAYYVQWFAFILAFDAYTTLIYAKFRLESRPLKFMFYRLANVVFNVGFVILFLEILPRFSPSAKLYIDNLTSVHGDLDYVFFANLLASFVVFVMMIPEFFKLKLTINKNLIKNILAYSWPLVIIIVAGNINQYAAVPLQNFLLDGDIETRRSISGIFGAGAKLAILLSLFTTAFNYAAEPFFFNQAAKDKKYEMNGVVAKAFTIFSALVVIGIYFYIDIVLLIIGKNYRDGVQVVPVLLLSYLFLGLYYNFSIWYKLADKTIYGAYISIVSVVITLALSAILLPTIGMMGSAWASLACFIYMAVAGYILGQKHFPIQYPIKSIVNYCLLTAALLLVSYIVRTTIDNIWMRMAINTVLLMGFCLYVYIFEKPFFGQFVFKKQVSKN
jgi:O-antigen/teichoic acid export membrane protein